jgi:hypothetical protein
LNQLNCSLLTHLQLSAISSQLPAKNPTFGNPKFFHCRYREFLNIDSEIYWAAIKAITYFPDTPPETMNAIALELPISSGLTCFVGKMRTDPAKL